MKKKGRGGWESRNADKLELLNRIVASEASMSGLSLRITNLEREMRAVLGVADPAALVRVVDEILAEFPTGAEGWAALNEKVVRLRAARGGKS